MNNKKKSHQPHPLKGKLIFSGILILLGVVLLGFNFGIISPLLKSVIFSWQMLVIALGVITLFSRNIFSGLFTILVGGFFLLPALHKACPECFPWVTNDFVGIYYPVLLIAAGLLFFIYWLLPAKCKSYFVHLHSNVGHQCTCGENCTCEKCRCKDNNCNHSHSKHSPNGNKCNCTLDKNVVFASSEEIYLDEEFTGGELNVVFGAINLDLRRTTLPEGETFLELNVVCGGIELYIPDTWLVEMRTSNVLAGFSDSRLPNQNIDRTRKLIITASFVCGGGEIR